MTANRPRTRVIVYSGTIAAQNTDPTIPGRQLLQQNQNTNIRQCQPPDPLRQFFGTAIGSGGALDRLSGGTQTTSPRVVTPNSEVSPAPAMSPVPGGR